MASLITVWRELIGEGTTPRLQCTLVDDGLPVTPDTLTKTVYNKADQAEITAEVSIIGDQSSGVLDHRLSVAETARVDVAAAREVHQVLLRWSWDSGAGHGAHLVEFTVADLPELGA